MIYLILIISISYLILIFLFIRGYDKVKDFQLADIKPKTTFSVIVPFRNEAENLPVLLKLLNELAYPKILYEVILVNDESTDSSKEIIRKQSHYTIIDNKRRSNSPKKDAITTAIETANYEWILTTDADCQVPKYWLDSFDAFIQNNKLKCIVAPVKMEGNNTFLERFQVLDFLSLQGTAIGSFGINMPILANGANLAYKKSSFLDLNGFDGNDGIASGDDVFLLQKFSKKFPSQIAYLKCAQATVSTTPEYSWKTFVDQRVRWASKTKAYKNWLTKFIGLVVFLMNALVIALFTLLLLKMVSLKTFLCILLIKFSIDFYIIYKTAHFFEQKNYLISYLLSFLIYPYITVFIVLRSLFGSYAWKGRSFKV